MQDNVIAILFALASALTIAWGTVVRHRIAGEARVDGSFSGSPLINAISRPLWWMGTSTALIGYGLQVVALGFGTLLVVQPVLVLSLMFTLPLSAHVEGRKMSATEVIWSLILTAAVAILVIIGRPIAGDLHPPLGRWLIALTVGAVVLGALAWVANYLKGPPRALALGVVTGAIFGYVAVLSKAFVDIAIHQGVLTLLTSWETYGLIAGATLGTAVQQYSFNAGALRHSLPAMTVSEPIAAFSLGYFVLREQFQVATVLGWSVMGLALLAMIVATFMLTNKRV